MAFSACTPRLWPLPPAKFIYEPRRNLGRLSRALRSKLEMDEGMDAIGEFDGTKPVEEASTLPSSWYTSPSIASLEMKYVFGRGWHAVGYVSQVEKSSSFFCGSLGSIRFVVCKDSEGNLHAFHNVCSHHAAPVALGSGCANSFTCLYHGWTYGLNGKLLKATRISGMKNFHPQDYGLRPITVATWGPFVLLNMDVQQRNIQPEDEWLGSASKRFIESGIDAFLQHVSRREYTMHCNWKVFCDNYLDGGYHVPYAHPGLAAGLDLSSYTTELFERVSVQSCRGIKTKTAESERLSGDATYAFVYPNFMINRYGPWMDTNLVLPIAPNKCKVVFDYFLESAHLKEDKDFVHNSLLESDKVQQEDIFLCEQVQTGLESMAYTVGRYAPKVEMAMHHFHCLLHNKMSSGLCSETE